MSLLPDKRTVRPNDLKPGDVMKVVITCHIVEVDGRGGARARYYDCGNGDQDYAGIPQGGRIPKDATIEGLFPILAFEADIENDVLYDLLSLVLEAPPSIQIIDSWTDDQKSQAEEWAACLHLAASDNPIDIPQKPDFIDEVES